MQGHDLKAALTASHETARRALLHLASPASAALRQPWKDQLINVLRGHLAAIEGVLLPAVQACAPDEVQARSQAALHDLKAAMAQLVVTDLDDAAFDRALADVDDRFETERHLEIAELVPAVMQAVNEPEARTLLAEIERCRSLSQGEVASPPAEEASPALLRDSVDEARVVLSSIPRPAPPP
jgi:hypothetical protein